MILIQFMGRVYHVELVSLRYCTGENWGRMHWGGRVVVLIRGWHKSRLSRKIGQARVIQVGRGSASYTINGRGVPVNKVGRAGLNRCELGGGGTLGWRLGDQWFYRILDWSPVLF